MNGTPSATILRHAQPRAWFLAVSVLIVIGLAGWNALVSDPAALFTYAILDLSVFGLLLVKRIIRNEFVILFGALGLLYTYSFVLEAVTGLTDPESFAIVINLSTRGLDLVPDSSAIMLATVLFRNAVLLGCWNKAGASSQLGEVLTRTKGADLLLVVFLTFGAALAGQVTAISSMLLLARNLTISLATMACVAVARWFRFRLLPVLATIFVAAGCLLLIDRSRLPIMVVALSLLFIYFSNASIRRWQVLVMSVAVLGVFVSFGYVRDVDAERGARSGAGILSQEETGTIFLVGAHVIGLTERGQLPQELSESVVDKLLRGIPGVGGSMLADKYVWTFFPEIAAGGGGFAYPAVAEWFVVGGALGVVLAGLVLGMLVGTLIGRINSGYAAAVTIVFCAQFFRQEFSASLLTVATLVAGSFALRVAKYLLVVGQPQPGNQQTVSRGVDG